MFERFPVVTDWKLCSFSQKDIEKIRYIDYSYWNELSGGTFSKMFFLTADFESYVIVEGHLRMTAYAIAPNYFNDIKVIVGKCDAGELSGWM